MSKYIYFFEILMLQKTCNKPNTELKERSAIEKH